jgi:P-type Cu+ transporter
LIAGAAMAFSSVSVVTNALLLRRWHPAEASRSRVRPVDAAANALANAFARPQEHSR